MSGEIEREPQEYFVTGDCQPRRKAGCTRQLCKLHGLSKSPKNANWILLE